MGKPETKERRTAERLDLENQAIEGMMTVIGSDQQLPFRVWDVSLKGMGLWTAHQLQVGYNVRITVGHPYLLVVDGEITWCAQDTLSDGFRSGIKVNDGGKKIQALMRMFDQSQTTTCGDPDDDARTQS